MPDRLPATVDLLLDDGVTIETVVGALSPRFSVETRPAVVTDITYLDTFDRLLDRHDTTVERARHGDLILRADGRVVGSAPTPGATDRIFAGDVAAGEVGDHLTAVIGVRALLSQARVRVHSTPLTIRNRDDKVVVRVRFDAPSVVRRGQRPGPLATRLHVAPVLGYRRPFAAVIEILSTISGVTAARSTLAHDAMGPPPIPRSFPAIGRSTPSCEAMVALCQHLADSVDANLPGTLADIDTEYLHDLRVAIRRTRSVVREMHHVLPAPARSSAREDLRWIQQITGPTRDLDVQLINWPETVGSIDPAAAADLAPLHALLVRKRAEAFRTMRRQLRSSRFAGTWTGWRNVLAAPESTGELGADATRPIADVAGARVHAVYRRMVRDGRMIDHSTPPEQLHELRKRGKELRYLLELFGPAWPDDDVRAIVTPVKKLQDVLGRFQDRQVESQYLRAFGPELAQAPDGPDALIALGLHLDWLAADQRRARRQFAAVFTTFSAKPMRDLVAHSFGAGARPAAS